MRTKNSVYNFLSSFFPWILLAILGFFKIRFFINSYGSEANGLVQLAHQVFSFLSIASLGFTSAIVYYLYEPLIKNDYKKINRLLSGAKSIFRIIGYIIFVGGIAAALLVPFILYENNLSYWFIFLLFFLYALDYLSSYLILLPYKVILEADQKSYIVNLYMNVKMILFRCLELFLIIKKVNILLILLISVITNLIVNKLILNKALKTYKWLDLNSKPDKSPLDMTKDVFYHRIMKFIFHNTDVMLISVFKGLTTVSIYGAYNYIIQLLLKLVNFVFKAPQAAIANYLKSNYKDDEKKSLINEYLSVGFFINLIIIPIFILSVGNFISLWINPTYVFSRLTIFLFGITLWSELVSYSLFTLIEAMGLFKETKKSSLIASLFNVVASLILIFKFEIAGVLVATIIGNIILHISYSTKIFKQNNKEKIFIFIMHYIINFISIIMLLLLYKCILSNIFVNNLINWFLLYGGIFISNLILALIITMIIDKNMKKTIKRIIYLKKK